MKKVLLLATCPFKHDGITKIEQKVIEYCKNYVQIEVACGYIIESEYRNYFERERVRYHQMPTKKKIIQYINGIKTLVKNGKYDVVYIHGNSALMLIEVLASKWGKVSKVITHCHNTSSNYLFLHYLVKPIFSTLVDIKIGCSELASRWAYCGNNFISIVNGIDIINYQYDEDIRLIVKKKLGWNVENKVVGHIGRFNKQKNHKKIISIFEEYHKIDNSARLLLIGEGELKRERYDAVEKKKLLEYVKFISVTDAPQDYMQAMDIMIMPSLYEGLGLVAIEAQANSLPILISNNFPREACSTELVRVVDLKQSDSEWCKHIVEATRGGRKDVTSQLYKAGYDSAIMLNKITEILIN